VQPNVNKFPMVFGVLAPKVNRMGNLLAIFANEILDGGLLQIL